MKRLEKLRAFWEKHGYLCVLSACFVLVMTTAVLTRKPAPQPESPETTRYVLESTTPTPRPASVQKTVRPTATAAVFALPCEGKTGMVYAPDRLIYQQTLGEYAVHGGVDYLGQEGGVVRAVENGCGHARLGRRADGALRGDFSPGADIFRSTPPWGKKKWCRRTRPSPAGRSSARWERPPRRSAAKWPAPAP